MLAALAYQVADAGDSGHTQSDLPLVPLTAAEIDYLERDVGSGRGGK